VIRHLLLAAVLAAPAVAANQPATLDLRADREQLFTLLERIAKQCDAGLAVEAAVGDQMAHQVTIKAKDAAWKDAVALLASDYGIALTLTGDRLVVSAAGEEQRRRLVRRAYEVGNLTRDLPAYPGPSLEIPEPGGQGAKLLPPVEPESKPEGAEILDTIQRYVRPQEWARDGVSISTYNTLIIIWQTPEVHAEIAALLERLERAAAREVVCRAYRLPAAPDVGPVVNADAWSTLAKSAGSPIASFVCIDGQQNHHFSGTQSLYVADTDIVQGVNDPIMTVLSRGLAIDVGPHATVGGVLVALRFDQTTDSQITPSEIDDPAGKPLATIGQPRLALDVAHDCRLVPPGGAAVLRFGPRAYALTFEVLDWGAAAAKP
jgi:hypothetical protein